MIVGEALNPKRQRVEQSLAQDDLPARAQRRRVEDAPVRARQVQVKRRARPQPRGDLSTVHLGHSSRLVDDRDHDRAVEVFVAALAQDAEPLKASAQLAPGLAVLLRQTVRERAVGKANAEVLDHLRVLQASPLEIGERLGALLERRVVVVDHLLQERLVVRARFHHRRQLRRRRPRRRRLRSAALAWREGGERGKVSPQHLDRAPKAHPLGTHHPVDHAPSRLARSQAVPEVLVRRDDQARASVFVEGTKAQ